MKAAPMCWSSTTDVDLPPEVPRRVVVDAVPDEVGHQQRRIPHGQGLDGIARQTLRKDELEGFFDLLVQSSSQADLGNDPAAP